MFMFENKEFFFSCYFYFSIEYLVLLIYYFFFCNGICSSYSNDGRNRFFIGRSYSFIKIISRFVVLVIFLVFVVRLRVGGVV